MLKSAKLLSVTDILGAPAHAGRRRWAERRLRAAEKRLAAAQERLQLWNVMPYPCPDQSAALAARVVLAQVQVSKRQKNLAATEA